MSNESPDWTAHAQRLLRKVPNLSTKLSSAPLEVGKYDYEKGLLDAKGLDVGNKKASPLTGFNPPQKKGTHRV